MTFPALNFVPFCAVYNLNATVLGVLIALYAIVIGYLGIRGFRKTKNSQDYLFCQ